MPKSKRRAAVIDSKKPPGPAPLPLLRALHALQNARAELALAIPSLPREARGSVEAILHDSVGPAVRALEDLCGLDAARD